MRVLVISGSGFVGSNLVRFLQARGLDVIKTSRSEAGPDVVPLDMTRPELFHCLPKAGIVFIVAAMAGFAKCEGNPLSWRVNVDAPIEIVKLNLGYPVFISSDCVEWSSAAYARQKAQVEGFMALYGGSVVRPMRIPPDRINDFCAFLMETGLRKMDGVHLWPVPQVGK